MSSKRRSLDMRLASSSAGCEVVEFVNRADRLGFLVADVNEPSGDFVAVVVLVGLRAVEENAAPMCRCWRGVVELKCGVAHRFSG